jgi:hypothetical protein
MEIAVLREVEEGAEDLTESTRAVGEKKGWGGRVLPRQLRRYKMGVVKAVTAV